MQLRRGTTLREAAEAKEYIMGLKRRAFAHQISLGDLGAWSFLFDKDIPTTYNEAIDMLDEYIENHNGGHGDDI